MLLSDDSLIPFPDGAQSHNIPPQCTLTYLHLALHVINFFAGLELTSLFNSGVGQTVANKVSMDMV